MAVASSKQLPSPETRQRLLEVASTVFARRGFRRTTVREISSAADANIAAVNYYFRNKAGLYAAVLRHGFNASLIQHPPDSGLSENAPPERKLHAFVSSFLHRLLASPAHPHARLVAMEMADPTPALDVVVREHIKPLSRLLEQIVGEILGPGHSQEAIMHCAMSIVGQCVFYRHAEVVISKIAPAQKHTPEAIASLTDHIFRFSLAGVLALRDGPTQRRMRHAEKAS